MKKKLTVFLTGPTLDNEKTWDYFAFFSIIARKMPKQYHEILHSIAMLSHISSPPAQKLRACTHTHTRACTCTHHCSPHHTKLHLWQI